MYRVSLDRRLAAEGHVRRQLTIFAAFFIGGRGSIEFDSFSLERCHLFCLPLRAVMRSLLETILAVSAGVALSTALGYLAYAAPGYAVPFVDWLTSPLHFSTFLWAVLGALFGLSALQFRRGRLTGRNAGQKTSKADDGQRLTGDTSGSGAGRQASPLSAPLQPEN